MSDTQANPKAAGIKDTLESIIIALILAFVFRCFFVEAFVIPTGSMAPTLLGANMRFKCPDCGYDFTSNFSAPQIPGTDNIVIPTHATTVVPVRDNQGRMFHQQVPYTFSITCPNCGFKLPKTDTTAPPVHYGDRILVLKYAALLEAPQRWDVIVFRSPFDQRAADRDPRSPTAPEFQQNYIKRLIGLPGEQIQILDGDIYARTSSSQPWVVQTKPKRAQDALWRIVSDLDHLPRGLSRGAEPDYRNPWITPAPPTAAATAPADGAFTLAPGGRTYLSPATGTASLAFDYTANPRKNALTDWLAFNSTAPQQDRARDRYSADQSEVGEVPGAHNVSDIQLRATLDRQSGTGPLTLQLTKRDHAFAAVFLTDHVDLMHTLPDGSKSKLGTAALPTGNLDVEFQNVDYKVTVRVNGSELISSTPQQYAPDIDKLVQEYKSHRLAPKPTITLSTADAAVRVSHLSVWRDIFYINEGNSAYRNPAWASPEDPIVLGKGEYFPLGDNSALSLDARFWKDPINLPAEDLMVDGGRVPERFMLGKAFFVYWPAGYRIGDATPGLIPNFGQMRLIH